MASAGSVFTASPETKTTIHTPPQDTAEGDKRYFPGFSPPRFRLSPSETTTGETWGSPMTSRTSNIKVSEWDRENPFYKHAENPQELGYFSGQVQQPVQRPTVESMERGLLSLTLHATPSTLTPTPSHSLIQTLPSQATRRLAVDLGSLADNTRQIRPRVDAFTTQTLLSPIKSENNSKSSHSIEWADTPTRHLIVTVLGSIDTAALKQLLKSIGNLRKFDFQKKGHEEFCIASFYDLRAARKGYERLRLEQACDVRFCSPADVASLLGEKSEHEGQVLCQVSTGGPNVSTVNIDSRLYQLMSEYGPVSSFTSVDNNREPSFLVRFYDTRNAEQVVAQLDGQYVDSFYLRVELYEPQQANWSRQPSLYQPRKDDKKADYFPDSTIYSPRPLRFPSDRLRPESEGSIPQYSPCCSPSYSPLEAHYEKGLLRQYIAETRPSPGHFTHMSPFSRPESECREHEVEDYGEMFRMRPRDPRHHRGVQHRHWGYDQPTPRRVDSYHLGLNKNTVDLERIAQGLDTRTTVMLRNIPNKVDQHTLKDFVDTTSHGKYNFLYLRIDFKNMCNVGYAFINFLDPLDIIAFVMAKSGKRWNKYNSDKVLDVTYANIQGIDQLVEKFRNSNVMDQPEAYRPKLYYSTGPLAGQEMPFPPSNNPNRKMRSITAAQHIGLFAPKINTNGKVWRKRE